MGNIYVERQKTYLAIRLEEDGSNAGVVADFVGSDSYKVYCTHGKRFAIELWRDLYVPAGFYLVRVTGETAWSLVTPEYFKARFEEKK